MEDGSTSRDLTAEIEGPSIDSGQVAGSMLEDGVMLFGGDSRALSFDDSACPASRPSMSSFSHRYFDIVTPVVLPACDDVCSSKDAGLIELLAF